MTPQPNTDFVNDTRIFHLVQKWFVANPDTPIPLDAWERKLRTYAIPRDGAQLSVRFGQNIIQFFTPDMIPILASISLGLGSDHLAGTIRHHGILYEEFHSLMSFENVGPGQKQLNPDLIQLSQSNITRAMVEALLTIPQFKSDLAHHRGNLRQHAEMDFLRSKDPDFWRSTELETYADEVLTKRPNKRISHSEVNSLLTPPESFSYKYLLRDDVTLEEVRSIIRHAGHTSEFANRDNHIETRFFLNVLLGVGRGLPEFKKIAEAINDASDPAEIREFSRAVIRSLSFFPNDGPPGEYIAENTLGVLDPVKYKSVVDSCVLRLNLMEWPLSESEATSPFHIIDESKLFRSLQDEIMAVPPGSMEMHHFYSLRHFAKHWVGAHDATGVDVEGLVTHVVKGLIKFQDSPRLPKPERCKQDSDYVTARTELFLKFSSKVKDPNYEIFNKELDSREKRILCAAGYDIREFKGMSNRDKGRVLSDELGL